MGGWGGGGGVRESKAIAREGDSRIELRGLTICREANEVNDFLGGGRKTYANHQHGGQILDLILPRFGLVQTHYVRLGDFKKDSG